MTNPIDLGKLQEAHKNAVMMHSRALGDKIKAQGQLSRAQIVLDNATNKHEQSKVLLDKAKAAMIEGARTVAQG